MPVQSMAHHDEHDLCANLHDMQRAISKIRILPGTLCIHLEIYNLRRKDLLLQKLIHFLERYKEVFAVSPRLIGG